MFLLKILAYNNWPMETIEKRRIPSPTYGITSCFSIVSAFNNGKEHA